MSPAEPAPVRRNERSAHSRHTSSGIRPTRISRLKTTHPTQMPRIDSSAGKTTMIATSTQPAGWRPGVVDDRDRDREHGADGGREPLGRARASAAGRPDRRGRSSRDATWASGLSFGPRPGPQDEVDRQQGEQPGLPGRPPRRPPRRALRRRPAARSRRRALGETSSWTRWTSWWRKPYEFGRHSKIPPVRAVRVLGSGAPVKGRKRHE